MSNHDLRVRLSGAPDPDGELGFARLGELASALQDLVTRIGRQLAGQEGAGRTSDAVERATTFRLRGLTVGSTVLDAAYGDPGALDIPSGVGSQAADRLWEVLAAIDAGRRPSWTTPLIARSAEKVIDAFSGSAAEVTFLRGDGRSLGWRTAALDRTPWSEAIRSTEEDVTAIGHLEAVDLRSGRFRLCDDVGTRIALHDLTDPAASAHLIGRHVSARGTAVRDGAGRLAAVRGAVLAPYADPAGWQLPPAGSLTAVLETAPTFEEVDGFELTDEELDSFHTAMGR